jgi:hypothetical protein
MPYAEQSITLVEHYMTLAARLRAKALNEKSPSLKAEWQQMADCYVRLAERSQSKPVQTFAEV